MNQHRAFASQVLLRGEQSNGALAIVEIAVPPRWEGPPLHHHAFDEAFYLLDGEVTFRLGDGLQTGAAGSFALARGGGSAHARKPHRRARALPARHHPVRLRTLLRPARRRGGGSRSTGPRA